MKIPSFLQTIESLDNNRQLGQKNEAIQKHSELFAQIFIDAHIVFHDFFSNFLDVFLNGVIFLTPLTMIVERLYIYIFKFHWCSCVANLYYRLSRFPIVQICNIIRQLQKVWMIRGGFLAAEKITLSFANRHFKSTCDT